MSDNALHYAASAGNVAEVQAQVGKFDINAKGQHDMTALLRAAGNGHTEVVKLLLSIHADVNIPDVSALKIISVTCDMCFPIQYLYTAHPSFCLLVLIVITCSRCTTSYNSTSYSILLLLLVFILPQRPSNIIFITVLLCFVFLWIPIHSHIITIKNNPPQNHT